MACKWRPGRAVRGRRGAEGWGTGCRGRQWDEGKGRGMGAKDADVCGTFCNKTFVGKLWNFLFGNTKATPPTAGHSAGTNNPVGGWVG